jgi:uncharacterized surface protein with fasciclin (FAS1) repeats
MVEGKINFKDLKDGEKLKTVNGKELLVHLKDGNATVNGAKIQGHDVEATNGVIHSLETVMLKN